MSFAPVEIVLRRLGRMARTSELIERGVTRHALSRAVREGIVYRPRQGVYALVETPEMMVHAAEHGGTIGCCAAGRLHGLWILDPPEQPHVWMGTAGTPRPGCTSCRIHWDDGHVKVGELPPLANTLLQIALCAGEEAFFAALESALRLSLLSPGRLSWLRRHLPVRLRWLIAFARGDADSGLESILRLRLHRIGISARTQVRIDGVGEVDLVIGDRLIIEADGRENHERERERAKDLRRDAVAASLGYTTLRFTYAMIVHDWALVEAAVRGAVARHEHLSPAS